MTAELPDPDERARAEALDAALDQGTQAQRRAGPRAPNDDLADLAARLRAAMLPMPELPIGGRTEVRAAALAVRGAKRRDRVRLLVAAVVTLVIGVVGGTALSSALQQQGPTTDQAEVQVDLQYASGYLAEHDSAKARQYIERASKAIFGKAPGALAPQGSTASETAAIAALREDLALQTERATRLEAQNAKLSKALGSMTRTAQADVPGPATGSTSSTTTLPHPPTTARTTRTTTTPTSTPPTTSAPRYAPPTTAAPTATAPITPPPTTVVPTTASTTTVVPTTAAPTTAAPTPTTNTPVPTVPVPTVPVPTTKLPSRSRGIGPPVPLAEPTTTTTVGVSPTTTPPMVTSPTSALPTTTATQVSKPKTTTTVPGVATSSTTTSSTTTNLSTTTTTVPTTTTTDFPGTTTTSVVVSTTTTSS